MSIVFQASTVLNRLSSFCDVIAVRFPNVSLSLYSTFLAAIISAQICASGPRCGRSEVWNSGQAKR